MNKISIKYRRFIKGIVLLIALCISIFAYNCNSYYYFDRAMSIFISIVVGLLTIEYWPDLFLRLVSGTVFLCALNNTTDELFFNPYTFDVNEKIFAVIIGLNFLYNLKPSLNGGTTKSSK